ncbi:hypothetical protein CK203_068964 [Vitis vinifera]|uniref:Uncharacterized protein n=1 Tax=Vitis vinifera TaxID=29760 RepID=A0A438F141_VITVI|nr:hypothetical protein CK203_068964 [Vitis vinifera]
MLSRIYFQKSRVWRADIEGLQLKQLNSREAENLEVPFFEEEIHFALMEMRGDKAPGLDGFTMAFLARLLGCGEGGVDQNAFVRERQILDASLVANEVIDYWFFGRWDLGLGGGMDEVVYFYCQILYINQWGSSWFLFELKGAAAMRSPLSLSFCFGREQLTNLSWILAWFEAASGLRINLAKVSLFRWGKWMGWRSWRLSWV